MKRGLAELKRNGTMQPDMAKVLVPNYLESVSSINCSEQTAAARASCHYLTEHEEKV